MFNLFFQLGMMIVSAIIQAALTPKPAKPAAATLSDFDAPTAESGRPVPWVFGTVWIKAPNMLWYGDLKTEPIKTKGGKK